MRASLLLLVTFGFLAHACSERTPEIVLVDDPPSVEIPPIPPEPSAASPSSSAAQTPLRVDPLGRLLASEDTPWGFALPRGAALERETPDLAIYQLRSTRQALREFYAHRRYHVVRRASGFLVLHSSDTLRDVERSLEQAKLVIHTQARHTFSLRFFPPPGTSSPIAQPTPRDPPTDRATGSAPRSRTDEPKTATQRSLSPRPRRTLRQEETFNPNHKKNVGVLRTGPRVQEWKKQEPGRTFYD
jgi:hypothetical protein